MYFYLIIDSVSNYIYLILYYRLTVHQISLIFYVIFNSFNLTIFNGLSTANEIK
jgi:hypothetical protein